MSREAPLTGAAKSSRDAIYNHPEIGTLLTLLSEATRPPPNGIPEAFIPPNGTEQASSNYNHIVFGQRGSGKSSLLRFLENQSRNQHRITAWIDQEEFTA